MLLVLMNEWMIEIKSFVSSYLIFCEVCLFSSIINLTPLSIRCSFA